MKQRLVLLPPSVSVEAVEIISTTLFGTSVYAGYFVREPLVPEVLVHVNSFTHFHSIEEFVPIFLLKKSSYPVAKLNS